MITLEELNNKYQAKSDKRFDEFEIEDAVGNLEKIQEEAYLEKSKWLGGDEKFVCLGIDLDKSSKLSARKSVTTMAKLYEYFTQNAVDFLNIEDFQADYIDIKGDGVFGIYQGEKAIERAFVTGITFRYFFVHVICPKFKQEFSIDLSCKSGIDIDKILVKKIGTRKYNNEVWAGKLVNNTSKLMALAKNIIDTDKQLLSVYPPLIVSKNIFDFLNTHYQKYAIMSCGCDERNPNNQPGPSKCLWQIYDTTDEDNIIGQQVYFLRSIWCKKHGDEYIARILQ